MNQFIDIAPPPAQEREYPPFRGEWTRSVVLVGASGSGKSAVGNYLAEYAGIQFIDADHLVEERLGTSIAQAVVGHPETFETVQAHVTAELLTDLLDNPFQARVVALGTSPSVTSETLQTLAQLKAAGVLIVELGVDVSEVSRRMGLNGPRSVALGAPRAMLTKMIAATHDAHATVVNVSVNTVGRTIADIGQEVLTSL